MQFVIVSGLSGAGKSKAASDLEDFGFYCVDNMPAEMIPQFASLCLATKGRYEKVALVTDVRGSLTFDTLFRSLDRLDEMHLNYSILFIEAGTETIIKRYKETRRKHPLTRDEILLDQPADKAGCLMSARSERHSGVHADDDLARSGIVFLPHRDDDELFADLDRVIVLLPRGRPLLLVDAD